MNHSFLAQASPYSIAGSNLAYMHTAYVAKECIQIELWAPWFQSKLRFRFLEAFGGGMSSHHILRAYRR